MKGTKTPSTKSFITLDKAAAKARLNSTSLCAVRNWLAEQLVAHEYAKLGQGGHTHNQVPLRRVFVDLPVIESPSAVHQYSAPVLFLESLLCSEPLILRDSFKFRMVGGPTVPDLSNEDGTDERTRERGGVRRCSKPSFSATLLIGGPGQGKSTLGQLACQLHRAALLKPMQEQLSSTQRELLRSFETPSPAKKSRRETLSLPQSPFLPLQIALPDLAAWLSKEQMMRSDNSPALLHFLADLPSAKTCGLTADNLMALACHMPSLIVLDGFDEVGATQDRERLVAAARDLLTTLATQDAVAQIVATTRPQGYAGELAQLGIPLRECYLAPLSRDEALGYAKKLVEAKIPGADPQKKALERLHEAAAEPATERLLTTPLQVTILTALVQQLGRAPRERWNLFSRYFSYTYDREIERGTYASRLLAEHRAHIEQIHTRVALLLQVEAERDGGASARMSRQRLEQVIEFVLAEDEVSEIERKELMRDIAVAAEQRLVFLVEPEPGSFGFEIRSLQEFMAAWAITSGRDSEIEARLQIVARAPMFRNVTLFAASRLFSEGSPLRDILADRVCRTLDEDPEDYLANLTRAGGLLALETLEEGAVLSQPKRARALMERSISLFSLPPGNEHARLARIVNSDTALVLREAIEQCIGGGLKKDQELSAHAGWICLIEATNHNSKWAIELGDNFWQHIDNLELILDACQRVGIPLGQWILTKIEETPERFPPESFAHLPIFLPGPQIAPNWASWLALQIQSCILKRQRLGPFTSLSKTIAPQGNIAEPICSHEPPTHWRGWVSAFRYENEPNALNIATALKDIADTLPKARWQSLLWFSSWPLATCLGAAEDSEDLKRLAKLFLSGVLGDAEDWRKAEKVWAKKNDLQQVFDYLYDDKPWSMESLKQVPPWRMIHIWDIIERTPKNKNATRLQDILDKANQKFQSCQSPRVRQWLAEICLFIIQKIKQKIKFDKYPLVEWVEAASNASIFLVPRPKFIPSAKWLKLLDHVSISAQNGWFGDFASVFKSLIDSKAHPVLLKMAILSLHFFPRHKTTGPRSLLSLPPDKLNNFIKLLRGKQGCSSTTSADSAILQIILGSLPAESDTALLRDIAAVADKDPSYWGYLLSGLHVSNIPLSRIGELIAKVYGEMGITNPEASKAIQHLRDILQTRKSDLDNQSMWDRLALPRPYPQPPLLPRLKGGIPSRPIRIEFLELRDVGVLHNLKLPFNAPSSDEKGQWVVILGPNGIGKTTLLRSLVLALRNVKDPAIWPKGTFSIAWQRVGGIGDAHSIDSRVTVKLGDGIEHITQIRPNSSSGFIQLPEQDRPRLFPLFAYGCRRGSALGGATREVDLTDDDGPEVATLFDEGASLIHAETWLLQLEGDTPKNHRSKIIFDAVIEALKILLNLEAIEISDRKVWITERGLPKLPFNALSDGYLTNAGWFLDLVARWLTLAERHGENIEADFLAQMRGLVLIDEIDLHLHPLWQIEIITRTRKLLPQMSFIVTTHNPLTLVGAEADEIWMLSNEGGKVKASSGVESPMLLTGGQIYRQYFSIDDIYPDGLGRSLKRYSFLSGYALRNDSEQAELERLQKQLHEAGLDPGWEVVPRKTNSLKDNIQNKLKRSPSRRLKVEK